MELTFNFEEQPNGTFFLNWYHDGILTRRWLLHKTGHVMALSDANFDPYCPIWVYIAGKKLTELDAYPELVNFREELRLKRAASDAANSASI